MTWAETLHTYANSEALQSEVDFWQNSTADDQSLPWPNSTPESQIGGLEGESSERLTILSRKDTASLIADVHVPYKTATDEVLLTALWLGLTDLFGETEVTIGTERHGREPVGNVDPSFIIGWLTSFFPITFPSVVGLDEGSAIRLVKERLQNVPSGGIGYGLLRYCRDAQHAPGFDFGGTPDILFNFLGTRSARSGRLLKAVSKPETQSRSRRCERSMAIEVNAWITEGQLEIAWKFSGQLDEDIRDRVIHAVESRLSQLIAHCLESTEIHFTPSDFPAAGLSQQELDRFLDSI